VGDIVHSRIKLLLAHMLLLLHPASDISVAAGHRIVTLAELIVASGNLFAGNAAGQSKKRTHR
jgi:hypothetical protein